jgi:glutamyl/glutaminyl-tRNA synthetase
MTSRCRFAPSPTGLLHVGGARTALFNLLFARSEGGRFVLRIEDTDRARSSLESERRICEDLQWLGIDWDEGPDKGGPGAPYRQSERLAIYREAAARLLKAGLAFEAWESREELEALREAGVAADGGWRYRRRSYSEEEIARYKAEGRAPVLRLVAPARDIQINDLILGEVTVAEGDLEDFVIFKTDGFPTYHFAVVVDDHHMQVTHVLRAQEHLLNTAKHLALYEALGWDPPEHGHMPLIFSMEGGKMSKRDKARVAREALRDSGLSADEVAIGTGIDAETLRQFKKKKTDEVALAEQIAALLGVELPEIDVLDFRRSGYLPEALVNYLALLGWSPGDDREVMTLDEMIAAFSIERVGRTAARFDREKLRWMGGVYVRAASLDRLLEAVGDYCALNETPLSGADEPTLRTLLTLYQPRMQTIHDLDVAARFFFEPPAEYGPAKALKKHLLKGGGLERLAHAREALAACEAWEEAALEAALNELAEQGAEGKLGKYAQPLRIAVSGGPVTPGIFETLALLGREQTLARVDACLAHFRE